MKKVLKISLIFGVLIFLSLLFSNVKAASLKVTTSNSNPTVGDSFTITISGGDGVIKSVTSSNTGVVTVESTNWVDREGTKITAKAVSAWSATITVIPDEVVTPDEQYVTGSGSVTINVKAKETSSGSGETSGGSNNTGNSNSNSGNSGKTNSSSSGSKNNASNKPNTNKDAVKDVEETEQEEEATPQFGMNSLMLNAIDENGEKQEMAFTPTFNIDTYEYTAEIESNIVDVEVLTEAGEYNDYVKVEKPESFNAGENIIKITMQKDDMSLTYTIKVNKKESEETVETVSDAVVESENKKQTLITFTIPQFIAVILTICLIEGLLLKLPWKKMIMVCKRRKGFGEDYDDELDNDETENGNENDGKNND